MYHIYPVMEFSVHFDGRSLRCVVCVYDDDCNDDLDDRMFYAMLKRE